MLVVAVLAAGLAWKRRWDHCQERARFYKGQSERFERLAKIEDMQASILRNSMGPDVNPPVRVDMRQLEHMEATRDAHLDASRRFDAIRSRYEKAAPNPFLPLPSEPGPSRDALFAK
jgi:hypothetical protein